MRKTWILAGIAVLLAACTDRKLTDAPTAIAGPTPVVPAPSLPTTVPGVLALAMPIEPGDAANAAFGLAPFGYHEAPHAADGHPGWEIEYRSGGVVRAAAAGTVEAVTTDPGGHLIVQVEHVVGTHFYRTTYTNLVSLAPDIRANEVVRAAQAIGTPDGTTHFQLDDFEYYRDISNPNAVSPEPFLTPAAKSIFDALWARAAFRAELIEPFATNPRELSFPASRTWTRAGGDGPAGIRFTRATVSSADYDYALLAESGTVVESGRIVLDISARPFPAIDLVSPTARRLGVFDLVSNEMRLSLAQPGSDRPADLSAASIYRTNR